MKNQPKTKIDTGATDERKGDAGIVHLKSGTCPSLSGKSKLRYAVGRSPEGRLHVRVVENSSTGCFSDDWFDLDALWQELAKSSPDGGPVTSGDVAKSFAGRSQNTAGFVFAAMRAEGLVVPSRQKRRCYDRVDAAAYEAKCRALLEGKVAKEAKAKKAKRKTADAGAPKRAARAPRKRKSS